MRRWELHPATTARAEAPSGSRRSCVRRSSSSRSFRSVMCDILGVQVSLGALSSVEGRVSNAVQVVVDEVWRRVAQDKVKHTNGTTWYQAGVTMALWTITTATATVFKIVTGQCEGHAQAALQR